MGERSSGMGKRSSKVGKRSSKVGRKYFPLFVDISDKKIVVVGGGNIAARRVRTLLYFTEDITVVSPEICEELRGLADGEKGIHIVERSWQKEDLEGAQIVLAATDRKEINAQIVRLCREQQILVNTADDKSMCDFYFPSIVQKEDIVVGISSGGNSPAKVKETRLVIEEALGREE